MLVQALSLSHLDYCKSVLYRQIVSTTAVSATDSVQNAAARLSDRSAIAHHTRSEESALAACPTLRQLPELVMFKTLHGLASVADT